jgi:transposase
MMTRYRAQLHGDRTREIVRLELMLEDASIKLSMVASSLKTVSARAILAAMIDGETDARVLAEMARGRMRTKIPDLAQALEGHFDVHHAQLARSILDRIDRVEDAMAQLDAAIEAACGPWAHQVDLLQTIPGVGPKVAHVFIAEADGNMSTFPTAAHLASWAGVAPAIYESAGRRSPAGRRRGNKWLAVMLVEAAGSVGRMHGKNYLAVQHARLTRRRGRSRAQIAVAHSILTTAYYVLQRDDPTETSARSGWPNATRKPTPAASSRSSNTWDTPSNSTPWPDPPHPTDVSGSARRAHAHALVLMIHGSVWSRVHAS